MKFIKFSGVWCNPCKQFAPVYDKLEEKYKEYEFIKVDVDDDEEGLTSQFKIKSIPTTIILDDCGIEIKRLEGSMQFNKCVEEIEKLLEKDVV